MPTISLPNKWKPRGYQLPLWSYLERGGKRAFSVWHRRAGKDDIALHWAAVAGMQRVGTYWHMLPEAEQARKAIWRAVDPHRGARRIDLAFPQEMRARTRDQEMNIEFVNGSLWQVVGSDNFDSLVGSPPIGVVFSEWPLADPRAWAFISPILEENGGWAIFNGTPRGPNHAKRMFEFASKETGWFCERLTAAQTGVFTSEQLDKIKREYEGTFGPDAGAALFEQEYECSFEAAVLGAYYGRLMADAERENRITGVPWDPNALVWTAWDLGISDATSIWFAQIVGREIHIIDYYESSGVDLSHYVNEIHSRRYAYGGHLLPHDAGALELGTGKTRIETLQSLGLDPTLVPMHRVPDGINAVRSILPKCWFDRDKTPRGVEAMKLYRAGYDEKGQTLRSHPVHDWCFAGDTKVLTRYGTYPIKELPNQGEVLTPCGWKPYHSPRLTRRNARLVEVRFAGGHTVRCTPDHMFMTANGWESAESLTKGSRIQSSLTLSRSISMAVSTAYGRAKNTIRAAAINCTGMFGLAHLGLSLAGATSTIAIQTQPTIHSTISNASRRKSISRSHGKTRKLSGRLLGIFRKRQEMPLLSGTSLMPEDFGTGGMPSVPRDGLSGSAATGNATTAKRSSKLWFAKAVIRKNIAAIIARPLRIESVDRLGYTEDVYCITVPGEESFSLANGAVVHNCSHAADAFRYLAMGLEQVAMVSAPRPRLRRAGGGSWMGA